MKRIIRNLKPGFALLLVLLMVLGATPLTQMTASAEDGFNEILGVWRGELENSRGLAGSTLDVFVENGNLMVIRTNYNLPGRTNQLPGSCLMKADYDQATGVYMITWVENIQMPPEYGYVLSLRGTINGDVFSGNTIHPETGVVSGDFHFVRETGATAISRTIEAVAVPPNGGSVTGGGTYQLNSSITLQATPNQSWVFDGWFEADTLMHEEASWSFTVDSNRELEARFTQVQQSYTITAIASPANGGTVTGGGTYQEGSIVHLNATPNSGFVFDGWYAWGSVKVSGTEEWRFTATADRTLEARFIAVAPGQMFTISATAGAGGAVTGGGTFPAGGDVTLTAFPDVGYSFTGWYENDVRVRANPLYEFTATSDRTIEARFAENQGVPNPHNTWFDEELERAAALELIPDSLLPPTTDYREAITRVEFAGIVVKAFEALAHTSALPTTVNPFTDTNSVDALKAYNTGLMVGVSETEFAPNVVLDRQTAATALTRVFKRAVIPGWSFAVDADYPLFFLYPPLFADNADISDWAWGSVYFMAANGIILGIGDNYFAPRNATPAQEAQGYANATREQAIVIALRMVESLG